MIEPTEYTNESDMGWLSPEGHYYSTDVDHGVTAAQNLSDILGEPVEDISYNPQTQLLNHGYIRIDFSHIHTMREPTFYQLNWLREAAKISFKFDHKYSNKVIREFIHEAERGTLNLKSWLRL